MGEFTQQCKIVPLMMHGFDSGLKFNLKSVKMMDLASDPQSIRFLRGNRISLPLLKHEIDRRMLKITCLVKKMDRKRRNSHHRSSAAIMQHRHIQTEAIIMGNAEEEEGNTESVLGVINEQEHMNRQQTGSNLKSHRKDNIKPSANKGKPSHLKSQSKWKEPQMDKLMGASLQRSLVEEHPLIESNGFTFRDIEQTHEGSTDRKLIQDSQDDKIFESLDFGLQISNVEMCNSITSEGELPPCRTSFASREPRSDTQMISAFTDLSGSELGKEVSRRHRKIRMAGRQVVLPQPHRRIIVSEECRQRVEREVEQLFGQRRKEVCDYKLRINVLKKIEEKYGEEYSA